MIKKGDNVIVITGGSKGKKSTVLKVLGDRVLLDGVNKVKKHLKPKQRGEKGQIIEKNLPVHISNVRLADGVKTKVAKKLKVIK